MYRGRFAPSPTGALHLGSAACALMGWLRARCEGGAFVIRVEDIDVPRVQKGAEQRQLDDLRWLGLDWDEGPDVGGPRGPYRQSERLERYDRALLQLAEQGLTYLCDCSRAEIARVASAPHAGDDGPRYPGTCRAFGMAPRAWKRPPAVRLMVPDRDVVVVDRWQGTLTEHVERSVGDFVLRRGDGIYAYQLAVVVDDLAMAVTEVVRGADLLSSTARQVLLCEMLGQAAPRYAHHPVLVAPDGARLAKRQGGISLADRRAVGEAPSAVVAKVAALFGLMDEREARGVTPRDLLAAFDGSALAGRPTVQMS